MTLEEALNLVEEKAGIEALAAVKVKIGELNEENKNHRLAAKDFETQLSGIKGAIGLKDGEKPEDFAARIARERETLEGDAGQSKSELKQVLERLSKMENDLEAANTRASQAESERKQKDLRLQIQEALVSNKAAEDTLPILTQHFAAQAVESDSGFKLKLGESEVAISEGVKTFLNSNIRFLAERQNGGSGGGSAAGGGGKYGVEEAIADGRADVATTLLLQQGAAN